jgi:nucleotide-binding universal stress UspA family protein
MPTRIRPEPKAPIAPVKSAGRPVLLATLDVPFEARAWVVAVDAAVESGQPLIVANMVLLPPLPLSVMMGYDQLEYSPELAKALREPAELARSLGLQVERLRVKSLHPVQALVELVRERHPGLLVFGPDRTQLAPRTYRRAARTLRRRIECLLWLADETDAGPEPEPEAGTE